MATLGLWSRRPHAANPPLLRRFSRGPLLAICASEDHMMKRAQVLRFAAMFLVVLTVACGDDAADDSLTGPSAGDPGISNQTDDFQFNLPNVTNYSTNSHNTWRNTGTRAKVTQNSSISSGTGTLIVRDAGGRIVYSQNLGGGGTTTTDVGTSGDWRVEISPSNVTGTINLRVQKD
jgi:hypothetical protein